MPPIALLAGEGLLPVVIAKALSSGGTPPKVIMIGEASPLLESFSDSVVHLSAISLKEVLGVLKAGRIDRLVLAGAVPKSLMFKSDSMDRQTFDWISSLPSHDDHSLLGAIVKLLEANGVAVVPYRPLIPESLAPEGFIAGRALLESEKADLLYGISVAREIVRFSFGQSLAVKNGAVLAVEAMEGTDEMILRAGKIAGGGTVVKMMRPDQDERFDLPTVGPQTLESMAKAGLGCLAVEAGRTVILDREAFGKMAAECRIAVTGFCP